MALIARLRRQLAVKQKARRTMENALRELQERFNVFLDNAPIAAFVRDEAGRHVYGNKPWADQFGRPLRELLYKTNWELFPRETALLFEASDQAARLRGEVSGLIESGLMPDGAQRWWKVYKFPLPGPHGEKWVGGLALDITDLMEARSRLPSRRKTEIGETAGERIHGQRLTKGELASSLKPLPSPVYSLHMARARRTKFKRILRTSPQFGCSRPDYTGSFPSRRYPVHSQGALRS